MKKLFLTGLAILLPVAITVAVVRFLVTLLTQPFIGLVSVVLSKFEIINQGLFFLSPQQVIRYGSQLLILICLFFLTVGLGFIAKWFFVNTIFKLSDKIIHRIPLINTVYKTTQEIIKTLFVSDKNSFKQVVMVPFPKEGSYAMGLIARDAPQECSQKSGSDLISVLIPTTPNPTTGFLLMVKRENLIYIDMKTEEAVKYLVSCGVIIPSPSTDAS